MGVWVCGGVWGCVGVWRGEGVGGWVGKSVLQHGGWKTTLGRGLPSTVFETGSLCYLLLCVRANWLYYLPHFPFHRKEHWDYRHLLLRLALHGFRRFELRPSCFQGKHCYSLSHFPASGIIIIIINDYETGFKGCVAPLAKMSIITIFFFGICFFKQSPNF